MPIFIILHTIIHLMQKKIWQRFGAHTFTYVFNSLVQWNLPCKRHAKNMFWGGCLNNILDSQTRAFSKVQRNHNTDPIVKLGSLGHNSMEYWAYLSSPWPWAIIPINVMGSPQIIFFATYNLRSAIFKWSIFSWITHKNSSLDYIDLNLQIWYKLLHNTWCKICFLSFNSYFLASLLFLANFDIKSFSDLHIIHFAKTKPFFLTSTLRWCLFLNLLIVDYEIPQMFNSLLIYENVIQKNDQITKHITILDIEN
jgi:hypothetical protein